MNILQYIGNYRQHFPIYGNVKCDMLHYIFQYKAILCLCRNPDGIDGAGKSL